MNKEKFDSQTNELYRSYGRFAVEFEQMCRSLKSCIIFAFQIKGLSEQEFIRVLLADQTAAPLITKLRAIISIFYRDKPSEITHTDPLFKFCFLINEQRNEIIHGTWYIGWASVGQTEFDIASGMKDKVTKKGVEMNSYSYTPAKFDELTEKMKMTSVLLNRLTGCVTGGFLPTKNLERKDLDLLFK